MVENGGGAQKDPSTVPANQAPTDTEDYVQQLRAALKSSGPTPGPTDAANAASNARPQENGPRHRRPSPQGNPMSTAGSRQASQPSPLPHQPSTASTAPRAAAGEKNQVCSGIYNDLLAASARPAREGWFTVLGIAPTARRGAADPAQLLRSLLSKFSAEQIRAAGVVTSDAERPNELRLHPDLSTPSKSWVAIGKENEYLDVIGASGCVRRRACPPLIMAAYDRSFRKALEQSATAFVTFSVEDMIVLRSLCLAACTATGLDQLSRDNLQRFRQRLGERPFDDGHVLNAMHAVFDDLVLVGWSIARMDLAEPPELAAVTAHLRALHQHLGVRIGSIRVWKPSQEDCQRLRFALRYAAKPLDIREIILEEIEHCQPLVKLPPAPEPSIATSYQNLLRAATGKHHMALAEHSQKVQQLFEDFTCRLLKEAELSVDCQEANCKFMIAQLSGELQVRLAHRQAQLASRQVAGATKEDRDDLNEILRIAKQIESLVRTIDSHASVKAPSGPFPFHNRFGLS